MINSPPAPDTITHECIVDGWFREKPVFWPGQGKPPRLYSIDVNLTSRKIHMIMMISNDTSSEKSITS
jgi:hypothetical protein